MKYLFTKGSFPPISAVVHLYGKSEIKDLNVIDDETWKRLYGTVENSMQAWERAVDQTISENPNLDENIRNLFGTTHIDHEEQKKKNREEAQQKPEEIPSCPYPLPTNKKEVKKINIPHKGLFGKMVIADYPDLEEINVGNNDLQALEIDNCPKLWWLNYAHNNLVEPEAKITNCQKLLPENIHNEHCQGGWERPSMTEEEIEDQKKKLNQTGADDIVREEKEELSEVEKDLVQIIKLIEQFDQALKKGDLTQATELLTEIKEFANKEVWKKIKQEEIRKLEQRLAELINQVSQFERPNKLIISLGTISLLFLITSLYFINQKAKSILNYWIKQIKHKNKRNH